MMNAKRWTVIYHIIAVAIVMAMILTACGEVGNSLAQEGETMETDPIEEQAMATPIPPTGLAVTLTITDIPGAHRFYKEVEVDAGKGGFDVYKIAILSRRITAPGLSEYKDLEISKTNKFIARFEGHTDYDIIYNSVAVILDVNNDIEFSSTIVITIVAGPDVNHI